MHGPVQVRAGNVAYARRYAVWGREIETLAGLSALESARNIKDVDKAMEQVTWNENLMAADSKGNIGYWHPGLHPLRPLGYDERLPYPGTGEAEWRGFLDRATQTPRVINPKQGWLANWNNVPSAGWTSGDAESSERLAGPYHRVGWLMRQVRRVARKPSFDAAQTAIRFAGSYAQQRGLATTLLKRADKGATGNAKAVLDALLAWDGSYTAVDGAGTVNPGVAIWEQYKDDAEAVALARLGGKGAEPLAGHDRVLAPVRHHQRRGVRAADAVAGPPAPRRGGDVRRARQALRHRGRGEVARAAPDVRRRCAGRRLRSPACRSSTAGPGSSSWSSGREIEEPRRSGALRQQAGKPDSVVGQPSI